MLKKTKATVSLDLDNLWAYLKATGNPQWESFPSYLDTFVPYCLDLLDKLDLKITFFIVGQDAALPKNHDVLKEIADRGHDIANHSFSHEPWMGRYSYYQTEYEIKAAEDAIHNATGKKTVGFRGPGFSRSENLYHVLKENNYLYDSSVFPTFIGPLARWYFTRSANLSEESREQTKNLYGSFKDGFQTLKNHRINTNLIEMPVTTIPLIKTPFHMSYLMFLRNISSKAVNAYLNVALHSCKWTRTPPNFLLHPTDMIGGDKVPEMKYFPGMNLSTIEKEETFLGVMKKFKKNFILTDMQSQAKRVMHEN